MPGEKKQFIVHIPGEEHVAYWDEAKFNANQDKLYGKYPDAQVTEVNTQSINTPEDVDENGMYAIAVPGEEHVAQWDGKRLAKNREALLKKYPGAQVARINRYDYGAGIDNRSYRVQAQIDEVDRDISRGQKSNGLTEKRAALEQQLADLKGMGDAYQTALRDKFDEAVKSGDVQYTSPQWAGLQNGETEEQHRKRTEEELAALQSNAPAQHDWANEAAALNLSGEAFVEEMARRRKQAADEQKEYEERLIKAQFEHDSNPLVQLDKRIDDGKADVQRLGDTLRAKRDSYQAPAYVPPGAIMNTRDAALMSDKDYVRTQVAYTNALDRLHKDEMIRDHTVNSFWANAGNAVANPESWTFGLGKLYETGVVMDAVKDQGSESAKEALEQTYLSQMADAEYQEKQGNKGRWGQMTGEMAQFVILNALGGSLFGGLGEAAKKKIVGEGSASLARRFLGAVASDAIVAGLTENTAGAANTIAEILQKHNGYLSQNEDGTYSFEDGDNWWKSIWNTETEQFTEYFTERLGEHFGAVGGKIVGKTATSRIGKRLGLDIGLEKLTKFISREPVSGFEAGVRNFYKLAGIQQYPGEVMEEEIGIVMSNLLQWRNPLENVSGALEGLTDKKQQADIFGGMAFSIGLMQAVPLTAHLGVQGYNKIHGARLNDSLNRADQNAHRTFDSEAVWNALKGRIDEAANDDMTPLIYEIANDDSLKEEEKQAALNYVDGTLRLRGFSTGVMSELQQATMTRRDAEAKDLLNTYGKFWTEDEVDFGADRKRTEGLEGTSLVMTDENGNAKTEKGSTRKIQYARRLTFADDAGTGFTEGFVLSEDEGKVMVKANDGKAYFVDKEALAQMTQDGKATDSGRVPLFMVLDQRATDMKDAREKQRMQQEARENAGNLMNAAAPGTQINIGTEGAENVATVQGYENGQFVVVDSAGQQQTMSPKDMAGHLGLPYDPKTDEQINEINGRADEKTRLFRNYQGRVFNYNGEKHVLNDASFTADQNGNLQVSLTVDGGSTINMSEQEADDILSQIDGDNANEYNDKIKPGSTIHVSMEGMEADYVFNRAVVEDGDVIFKATDTLSGEEVDLTPEMVTNLDELMGGTEIHRDVNGNPVPETPAATIEGTQATDFFDDPVANALGISQDYVHVTPSGNRVVNRAKLWEDNPELWARWYDQQVDKTMSTRDYLENKLKKADEDVAVAVNEYAAEDQGEQNPDRLEELRAKMNEKMARQQQIKTLFDKYDAAQQTAARDAENAQRERENAAAAAEQPAVQQSVAEEQPAAPQTANEIVFSAQAALGRAKDGGAKAGVLQKMFDDLGTQKTMVTTSEAILADMQDRGASEKSIREVANALQEAAASNQRVEGFFDPSTGTIYMLADQIGTAEDANRVQIHEDKHMENDQTGAPSEALRTGVTREEMAGAMRRRKKTSFYDNKPSITLADELLAVSAEIAEEEGVEAIPQRLRELGITNEEFINFVQNNIDYGRRNGQRRHLERRTPLQHEAAQVSSGQDGRNREPEPAGVGRPGDRPDEGGRQGTRSGEAEQPAGESGAVEQPQFSISGEFGEILRGYEGRPKEAIQKLIELQDGEAVGALSHREIGPINLVWGKEGTGKSDGFGLSKLVKYHPDVVDNLQEILDDMHVINRSENRIKLESDTHSASVSKDFFGKPHAPWLLTAFEKKNSALDNTMDTGETLSGERNDTATPQSTVSESKDNTFSEKEKENLTEAQKKALAFVDGTPVEEESEGIRPSIQGFDKLDSVGIIVNDQPLLDEYGLSDLTLTKKDDVVTLNKIVVKDKGQGNGTRFMQDLINEADTKGWTLALTPDDSFGATSVGRLKTFYRHFGFKPNRGRNTDFTINESMVRKPLVDETRRLNEAGLAANNDEVRFSVRYAPAEDEAEKIASDIAKETGVSLATARKWVQSEMSLAAIILGEENAPYLDYTGDDRYTAIKNDSDYPQGTVDFNNICRKRLPFTYMYQRIQKAFPNTVITGEDLATIRQIMKDHGLTVACGLCYVEDRRQLLGEIADGFIHDLQDKFGGYSERKGYLDKPNDKGDKETRKKVADELLNLVGADSKADLSIYDLITLEGAGRLAQEHPGIYAAFQRYNSARGQQAGNLFQGYAEYKREILKWNKKKVKSVNANGGLRIFSYSDFEAHHLIDLVQIIQDCARKGVMIQGYTKVPAFARAIANTGIKLNRSLIPLGDTGIVDGKLAYDPVEGIDINDPDFLESNDNVGNILIGINDEQIRLAMADPFVHYIIPYHSNQKDILRKLKQTGAWTNYKNEQTEKGENVGKHGVNIYTDVLAAAEKEGKPIKNEKQFVERFLAVCKEKGWMPRFARFLNTNEAGEYVYTPGYYKLLLDFKLFDEKGRILPQKPVKAQFDDAFNAKILQDYVAGERTDGITDYDEIYDEIVDKLGLEDRGGVQFSVSEDSQKLFDAAKERFGTTRDIREAGYVLPDGAMLDFSGRHWLAPGSDSSYLAGGRQVDHREIADLEYERDGNTPTGIETSMSDFIRRGAIRINDGSGASINLSMKPTPEQTSVLTRLIEHNNGDVYLDLGDGDRTEASTFYDGAKARRVINDIKRYFDEGIAPEGGINFSIRGVLGAAEDATAMTNLDTAKEMESAGKDAKTIWLATGWEKGTDGKWRSEIPDGKPKTFPMGKRKLTVGDIIDAPELFASYPEIKDYKVTLKKMSGAGAFLPSKKEIELDSDYNVETTIPEEDRAAAKEYFDEHWNSDPTRPATLRKEMEKKFGVRQLDETGAGVVMHELQHAIQEIEGFAKGGSTAGQAQDVLSAAYKEKPNVVTFARAFTSKNSTDRLLRFGREKLVNYIDRNLADFDYYGDSEEARRRMTALRDHLAGLDAWGYRNLVYEASRLLRNAAAKGKELYNNLAGEVESRNVEKRMRMTEEERRNTPPSETEDVAREEQGVRFSVVTDPAKIEELENGEKELGYRTVTQNPDGSFGSPKASKLGRKGAKGVKTSSFELGQWEQAEENPQLATEDGKINLADLQGVDYNPYIHIRPDAINKQFTSAWRHPEQVYIQTSYPASEMSSGYHAEKAKLPVGRHAWTNGDLILSRWDKPERIVPWEEVADAWEQEFKETGVTFDIVSPNLLPILAERGVEILPPKKAAGKPAMDAYERWKKEQEAPRFSITAEQDKEYKDAVQAGDMKKAQRMVRDAFKASFPDTKVVDDEDNPKSVYHGTDVYQTENHKPFYVFHENSHFGTWKQAEDRLYNRLIAPIDGRIYEVYLNLQNPKRVEDMPNEWGTNGDDYWNAAIDQAKSEGYDGIIYENRFEGAGEDSYIAFSPSQIKSALPVTYDDNGNVIPLSERFNPENEDIRFSVSNRNQEVFVSNAERAVGNIRQEKATPEQWLKMIEKNGGLKAGEDKWLGLSQWLKDSDKKTLTKQEILDFIGENQIKIEEQAYSENVDLEEAAKRNARETIADGKSIEDLQAEIDELIDSPQRYDAVGEDADAEELDDFLMDAMEETYGEDFRQAYYIEDGVIDYNISPYDIDEEEGGLESENGERKINATRLEYTTDGLENKREIALTVPTIEPWNEDDSIHFGDAGEGRAVAWIRFGDTTTERGKGEAPVRVTYTGAEPQGEAMRRAIEGILINWNDNESIMRHEDRENQFFVAKSLFENALNDNMPSYTDEQRELSERTLESLSSLKPDDFETVYSGGKRVLFIDEIQSKRHQEGREKGYRKDIPTDIPEFKRYEEAKSAHREYLAELRKKYGRDDVSYGLAEEERSKLDELNDKRFSARLDWNDYLKNNSLGEFDNGIPTAPFEKNWHELAMKRMLRLAAEEGYDYVAWTKGEQQAERYSLSKVITGVQTARFPNEPDVRYVYLIQDGAPDIELHVNEEGVVTSVGSRYFSEYEGKKLSDIIGKELAVKTMATETDKYGNAEVVAEGEDLRIGGEGMKGFYDEILPRFMNKYGKQWGVKVEDITLPGLETGELSAHAVPVTQEMKDSVMEGQLMFSVAGQEQEERAKQIEEAEKFGLKGVIGEEGVADIYREAYASIPKSELAKIVDRGLAEGGDIYAQLRIYMHELAKRGTENDETGLLFKLFDDIRFMASNPALTDADIRWMLFKETSSANEGDLLALAEERAMRNRWGVGLLPAQQLFQDAAEKAAEEATQKAEEAEQKVEEAKVATASEHVFSEAENSLINELRTLTKAMAEQKAYDKATVDSVVKFAKEVVKNGRVSAMTAREVSRLLSLVNNATGKSPKFIARYVNQLMDMLLDNIVAQEEARFMKLANVKARKVNQSGVEAQGKLDIIGQAIIKAFRENMDSPVEDIETRIKEVSDRILDDDDAIREEAQAIYSGLMLALQYKENIAENIEEYKDLDKEFKDVSVKLVDLIGKKAYDEFIRSSEEALRKNRMERIDMYRDLSQQLTDIIKGGVERAAAFREADKKRVEDIHHDANRDMKGTPAKVHLRDGRWQRFLNSDFVRFFTASLATGDQMFRLLGRKSATGEGYLYNRYIRNGFIPAAEKASRGLFEAMETLDKKAAEVFDKPGMKWSDIYSIERKMPGMTVSFLDGDEMVDHELTQGNMLYIYMANKMQDGKMKLRRMGISEEDVEAIKEHLDPRFVELADWMQDEFYVNLRNKYNAVHERMFGAPMAAIDDYVPLKILSNARFQDVDLGKQTQAEMSSTVTGSIIKRRKNSLALDILHTDAFSLAIEHIQKMEDWAAFAEYRRDMNTLLSYKHFHNQVQNMNTVYGSGEMLWANFQEVCSVLTGSYKQQQRTGKLKGIFSAIDRIALNGAKGVTGAKIAFRVNTAIKQLLSFPAYFSDARPDLLMKSIAKTVLSVFRKGNVGSSWKWCMENLPLFEKRWKSRIAGDTRLLDTDSDWAIWKDNFVKSASRLGMTPNAAVDAFTVAIGAKAMYDTKKAQYIKDGYSEEKADEMAKRDAEILYNQTQQSSENAFVSPVQLDRTVMAVTLTTYRNSSMAYQRQLHDAIRSTARMMKPGYRARSIAFMKNQNMNNGLSEEQAQKAAERQYNRQWYRNLARVAIFGYGLQFLWKIGNDMWYLFFGDDDDEKNKILEDAALAELAAPVEGLVAGNVISEAWGKRAEKKNNDKYGIKSQTMFSSGGLAELPLESDMSRINQQLDYDQPRAINGIIDLLVQSGVGVNPQTLTDAVVALIDYANGDLTDATNIALGVMRIAQIPQSTIERFLVDQIDMEDADKRKAETDEMAKQYAAYKVLKNAPITRWMYNEGDLEKRLKSQEKAFKDAVKRRIALKEAISGEEVPETPEDFYKSFEKEMKSFQTDLNRAKNDNDTLTQQHLEAQPEYKQYVIWKNHQKGINKLKNSIEKTVDENLKKQWEQQRRDSIQTVMKELNENK